ncbi:50S ribosomal protein L10 [Candidatus Parvarchaeota archaeon]|uniref:50S ribosomal protein L10 n=1 Tax=Candidatus Acidifodinimicrobium mancum TaxID=2898728 RepID=A0A8T3V0G4_9ARCH|nr:50S ribosomal protein L10 [Candidatus Acidifodinimicrobium mancum]MBE5728726.1 50S ribosomal protein L10 [Candidatus Acidifodinimicrobium mancum]MBE5730288.1 50S ribosomal protein L10 [Candidatus Acidifodinimicrobium mancum]
MNKKRSTGSIKKEKKVKEILEVTHKYKTLILVELNGFPSSNFEKLKKALRSKASIIFTNKIVVYNALKQINENLSEKAKKAKIPVLILSNLDPFELMEVFFENRDYKKAKTGETAKENISLPSGPTPFPPGPMLSQFSSIGVKTKTEGGKISIISDTVVVKKGEKISEKVAAILASMDIKPDELILDVESASSGGVIFDRSILYTRKEDYIRRVSEIFAEALTLSVKRGIINKFSIAPLIKKIYIGVKFLSVDRGIVSKSTINDILARASLENAALAKLVQK